MFDSRQQWKLFASAIFFISLSQATYAAFKIGVGRADCTGPSAEIVFMGYAKSSQKGCGIHLRQFSRAYIVDDGTNRVAFVTVDACMVSHGLRKAVLDKLTTLYNDTYTVNNLVISGTHTHGTPGGFLMDLLFDITTFGFVKETFNALVDGISKSIITAHESLAEGKIYINSGELEDANINRSPTSYLNNPEDERNNYSTDTDKTMVQLKFVRSSDNTSIGALNWYAVHGTSMNNTNCLVSSDNVGYASILLEQQMSPGKLPGQTDFVAAFASTNLGDVSPNLKGPKCINTGETCDLDTSTCNGQNKYCIAFGPGDDMFESTEIIATRLFNKAAELFEASTTEVTGSVNFVHQFVEMPNQTAEIQLENGTIQQVRGCLPAMGYSFAAGTTDGPGEFDFKQGTTSDNAFWNIVRDFISPPTPDDVACHHPKPILLNTGRLNLPYQWQPHIVATSLLRIGDVVLAAVPGEFTTMSGRRLRAALKEAIKDGDGSNVTVVITGLSNVYTDYIATPEEYQVQRYEGASTIFGPHTLTIYLKVYKELAAALTKGTNLEAGPTPPDFSGNLLTLVTPVLFDTSGWSNSFGDCTTQPPKNATIGDTVSAIFISGHPRNDVMHGKTFLTVERQESSGDWTVVATDANWETRFIWRRTDFLRGGSEAEIRWTIPEGTTTGTYRIQHFGNYKYILGGIYSYQGTSRTFEVLES